MSRGLHRVAALLAAGSLLLAGCSQDDTDMLEVHADFPQAVALYPGSAVLALGVPVGEVLGIEVVEVTDEATGRSVPAVRVRMQVDASLRMREDVWATITPVSLIGERNIILTGPPSERPSQGVWGEGFVQAEPDADGILRIPPSRIGRVVEPDDVLKGVTDFVEAINPERLGSFLADTAETLDGHGEGINQAIGDGAQLLRFLDSRSGDMLDLAEELRVLAAELNSRQSQIERLVNAYTHATGILASERENFVRLIEALQVLVDEGGRIVTVFAEDLPQGLADLLQIQLRIEANVDSLNQMMEALPQIGELIHDIHREGPDALTLRLGMSETTFNILEQILEDLLGGFIDLPDLPIP